MAVTLPSCSMANESAITMPHSDNQRLIASNLSLTTESFFKAYMSTDMEQRRLAEMYVIGVIDSSEGSSWCGFEIASPDAIQEQIYIALKSSSEISPKERASTAIVSHLKKTLPCKDQHGHLGS